MTKGNKITLLLNLFIPIEKNIQEIIIDKMQNGVKVTRIVNAIHAPKLFSEPGASKTIPEINMAGRPHIPSKPITIDLATNFFLSVELWTASLRAPLFLFMWLDQLEI